MAILVTTDTPNGLLAKINEAINKGHVTTWIVDSDGDFTHTPDQWNKKAWLRPTVTGGKLVFKILRNTKVTMTRPIYGVYHGRFIEMLVTHFDLDFSSATATALPSNGDVTS